MQRKSFEEWLRAQGLVGKNENTLLRNRHSPVVNYLFENTAKFVEIESFPYVFQDRLSGVQRAFTVLAQYASTEDSTSLCHATKQVQNGNFSTLLSFANREAYSAIAVDEKAFKSLQQRYLKEVGPASYIALREQEKLVADAKTLLTDVKLAVVTFRIDQLQQLALNKQEGAQAYEAMSAYQTSLQCYIALNRHYWSNNEYQMMLAASNLLMKNGDVKTGLRQDVNWLTLTQREHRYDHLSDTFLTQVMQDAEDYLKGTAKRPAVINGQHSKTEMRILPQFMPDNKSHGETDLIIFQSGDTRKHFTVSCIQKVAVDLKGEPIPKRRDGTYISPVHHFRFYYTKHNAGYGAKYIEEPTGDASGVRTRAGIVLASEKHEVLPFYDEKSFSSINDYYHAMYENLVTIMVNERLLATCENKSLDNNSQKKVHHHYRAEIRKLLDEKLVLDECKVGVPQTSGNCTAMSQKAALVACFPLLNNLLEEHWRFVKMHNRDSLIAALTQREAELDQEIALRSTEMGVTRLTVGGIALPRAAKGTIQNAAPNSNAATARLG